MTELVVMQFGMVSGSKETCIRWGAHWHNLVNTTEQSMCGGVAACRQNPLTTCYICHFWRGNVFTAIFLSVSEQDNSKSYGRIFTKFGDWVEYGEQR